MLLVHSMEYNSNIFDFPDANLYDFLCFDLLN